MEERTLARAIVQASEHKRSEQADIAMEFGSYVRSATYVAQVSRRQACERYAERSEARRTSSGANGTEGSVSGANERGDDKPWLI
jgi:hypothetical protein